MKLDDLLLYLKNKYPDRTNDFFDGAIEALSVTTRQVNKYINSLKIKIPRYQKVSATKRVCPTCGTEFIAKGKKIYCKITCSSAKKKAKKERKRLRKRGKRVPKWVDMHKITEIYDKKPDGYEVDHIIPLNHPNVCGLHVPENLQYLTKEENRIKKNSWDGTIENNSWRNLLK